MSSQDIREENYVQSLLKELYLSDMLSVKLAKEPEKNKEYIIRALNDPRIIRKFEKRQLDKLKFVIRNSKIKSNNIINMSDRKKKYTKISDTNKEPQVKNKVNNKDIEGIGQGDAQEIKEPPININNKKKQQQSLLKSQAQNLAEMFGEGPKDMSVRQEYFDEEDKRRRMWEISLFVGGVALLFSLTK